MFPSRLPGKARYAVFLTVTAVALAGGLVLHGLSLAAVYFAVLPAVAGYVLFLRPSLTRHLRYYHFLYVLLLTAMVAGYLVVLARAVPDLSTPVWTGRPVPRGTHESSGFWLIRALPLVVLNRAERSEGSGL